MPGTITPNQMYNHELNPRKGWPSPYALDKTLPLYLESDTSKFGAVASDFKAGMVCHVKRDASAGCKFRLGIEQDTVPCFIFPNGSDFDVIGDSGTIIGSGSEAIVNAALNGPTAVGGGNVVALVGLGDYELETTECVTVSGLEPNLPLTGVAPGDASVAAGAESGSPGKIKAYTWASWRQGDISDGNALGCIGIVSETTSDGKQFTNEFGKTFLRFWPTFLPVPTTQP